MERFNSREFDSKDGIRVFGSSLPVIVKTFGSQGWVIERAGNTMRPVEVKKHIKAARKKGLLKCERERNKIRLKRIKLGLLSLVRGKYINFFFPSCVCISILGVFACRWAASSSRWWGAGSGRIALITHALCTRASHISAALHFYCL